MKIFNKRARKNFIQKRPEITGTNPKIGKRTVEDRNIPNTPPRRSAVLSKPNEIFFRVVNCAELSRPIPK